MLRGAASACGAKKDEHRSKMLTTRKQVKDAKDKGDICGWFSTMPRGRSKKKEKLSTEIEDTSVASTNKKHVLANGRGTQ